MTDKQLQQHVIDALDWEPSVDAAEIGVSVDHGVVTLRGDIRTFAEKAAAERVALGVYGAKAVANDLVVRLGNGLDRTDTEIAQAALSALRWNTVVPFEKIAVTVSNGWLSLKGELDWNYQRLAAANIVRDLRGVRGVTNLLTVVPRATPADLRSRIESALKRSAEVDARRISIAVEGGKVTLTGNVHSWFERTEADKAAWAAPGVREVDDRIAVTP
jgi:osmotically-inducible protein OsmY